MNYLKHLSSICQRDFVKTTFQSSYQTIPQIKSSFCFMNLSSRSSVTASMVSSAGVQDQRQIANELTAEQTIRNSIKPKISYHTCTTCDRLEMIDFMLKLFVIREPLMKAFLVTPQNAKAYVAYNIDQALDHNASFFAVNEDTGDVCGLRVNAIGLRHAQELQEDFGFETNAFAKFMHYVENDISDLPNTERCMRHVAICVDPSLLQCGIATELMKLSVDFAEKRKLVGLMAMCSWKLPYVLARKMGYKVVKKVPYDEYAMREKWLTKKQLQSLLNLATKEGVARVLVKKLP